MTSINCLYVIAGIVAIAHGGFIPDRKVLIVEEPLRELSPPREYPFGYDVSSSGTPTFESTFYGSHQPSDSKLSEERPSEEEYYGEDEDYRSEEGNEKSYDEGSNQRNEQTDDSRSAEKDKNYKRKGNKYYKNNRGNQFGNVGSRGINGEEGAVRENGNGNSNTDNGNGNGGNGGSTTEATTEGRSLRSLLFNAENSERREAFLREKQRLEDVRNFLNIGEIRKKRDVIDPQTVAQASGSSADGLPRKKRGHCKKCGGGYGYVYQPVYTVPVAVPVYHKPVYSGGGCSVCGQPHYYGGGGGSYSHSWSQSSSGSSSWGYGKK